MHRAIRFVRGTLESSGDLGLALSVSLIALHWMWLRARSTR